MTISPEVRTSPVLLGPLAVRFHRLVLQAGTHDSAALVAAAAAMVLEASMEGHSCLGIGRLVEQLNAPEHRGSDAPALTVTALREALASHPWVASGDGVLPLVFEHERLYLRRFREAERRLAAAILERAPNRFSVVTGGPGTGKTTSVARRITELRAANPSVRIALSAPTGKAATRLGEAIDAAWRRDGVVPAPATEPLAGRTLHRLLGYDPKSDTFRRTATDPLEHDVVIVDEASMVPLLLMDALFEAVRPSATIVLLGDHDQLASVETGAVLADIVRAADTGPLAQSVERLDKSYRFDPAQGIGALARAIRDGDSAAALAVIERGEPTVLRGATTAADDAWVRDYANAVAPVFDAASPAEALDRLGHSRVLCATNVGPSGTEAIIPRVERALGALGHDARGPQYRGRPLLITRNDYALELFNGDIGVVWEQRDEGGTIQRRAFVATPNGTEPVRGFPLPQLPDALTAWAMSIHKSQGSEFDDVTVVLPEQELRSVSRELLYTAVTRARKRVVIVGSDAVIAAAVERSTRRESGLEERLRRPGD